MAGYPERDRDPTARRDPIGAPGGSWYAWWKGDHLPVLPPLPGFGAESVADDQLITRLLDTTVEDARVRLREGHHLYVARLGTEPAGYGWSATATASIGELRLSLTLPPRNHYLWGFVTEPAWRGKGIYPRLLQAILAAEASEADRFWIGHEPGNDASARGILKAGFHRVGDVYLLPDGGIGLLADGAPERGAASVAVLGVRLLAP